MNSFQIVKELFPKLFGIVASLLCYARSTTKEDDSTKISDCYHMVYMK